MGISLSLGARKVPDIIASTGGVAARDADKGEWNG